MAGPDESAGTTGTSPRRRPSYLSSPLHLVLLVSDTLARVSPLALTPAWLALAAIAAWPWAELRLAAGVVAVGLTALDGVGLALLPVRGRSYGPVTPPLLALVVFRTALIVAIGLVTHTPLAFAVACTLALCVSGLFLYATWVEPFRITVTREELRSPKLGVSEPLRVVHLTDLHVERITARERAVIDSITDASPDIIVLTGDYLNLSFVTEQIAQAQAREVLLAVCDAGSCPTYAVTGSPPVDLAGIVPDVFEGLPITWLRDESAEVQIRDHRLAITGLTCTRDRSLDAPRARRLLADQSAGVFRLLLYHSPDLMPEAAELGVDLYLCGHTHGGQIRLPIFGAIITSSDFWKRYEIGRYEMGGTTLYVNRGLGLEGMGAPRARLLASPEVVIWELSGTG